MSRFVRQFLFASLIACHAAVILCGPCLHALPGSTHEMGATTKSHAPDDPLQSRRDTSDHCLICHFVEQGQLTVEFSGISPIQPSVELAVPSIFASRPFAQLLPSSPALAASEQPTLVVIEAISALAATRLAIASQCVCRSMTSALIPPSALCDVPTS